jgi:hypothetical protein
MLADIVVDTNVLVHANNPETAYFEESRKLADALLHSSSETKLRVDDGFRPIEAENQSQIVSEYWRQLAPGMLGHHLVQTLAAEGRIRAVPPIKDKNLKDKVRKLVNDKSDRVFLLTAIMSTAKVLVSHDDQAFPESACASCADGWGVNVCEALGSLDLLAT